MSDVSFNEEEPIVRVTHPKVKKQSVFYKWVISAGFAKTDAEAERVLIITAVIAILFAIGLSIYTANPPRPAAYQAEINANNAKLEAGR